MFLHLQILVTCSGCNLDFFVLRCYCCFGLDLDSDEFYVVLTSYMA
jgi:hypothetical protein